ncbi:hypothetical protein BTHI11S_04686 [Bosea thiooxidans]
MPPQSPVSNSWQADAVGQDGEQAEDDDGDQDEALRAVEALPGRHLLFDGQLALPDPEPRQRGHEGQDEIEHRQREAEQDQEAQEALGARAAQQQDEGARRQDDEEEEHADLLQRRLVPEQPDHAQRKHREDDVDPPALADRIGAVDEVLEAIGDIGPAGADRPADLVGEAGVAMLAGPDRIEEVEPDQARYRIHHQIEAEQGQDRVERAGEQVGPDPGPGPRDRKRRGLLLQRLLADVGVRGVLERCVGHRSALTVRPAPCAYCTCS